MNSIEDTAGLAGEPGRIPGTRRIQGLATCFLVLFLDGLDAASIAFLAPVLANEWSIPISAFTPAFVVTSLGAVIGYVACGPLAQSIGPRAVGAASIVLFGLGTLAMATAWDVASLSTIRFVAAIGLGGVVPITIVAAADLVAERRRETATMLVASGLSAGAAAGGLIGGPLMRAYGWEAVFVLGGVLPLLVLPLFVRVPQPTVPTKQRGSSERPRPKLLARIFTDGLAGQTTLLWTFALLIFAATHALVFWSPALLLELGFKPDQAPLGTAAFGMGGFVGNVSIIFLVAAIGIKRLLAITTVLAMACVIMLSRFDLSLATILLLIAGLGAGTITGCIGQAVLAVSIYPKQLRATGVGCATAMGRIGSILGPAAGGLLFSFDWPARDLLMISLIPTSLTLLALAWLGYLMRRSAA